jgi:hypothetical protein
LYSNKFAAYLKTIDTNDINYEEPDNVFTKENNQNHLNIGKEIIPNDSKSIRNNINIEYNGVSKTLQNYNSQYFLNTIEENLDDNNYALNQKTENNKDNMRESKNSLVESVNEESKNKHFRRKSKKSNLELNNYVHQTAFTSPKDIMSTKSTNQNNLNHIKNEFSNNKISSDSLRNSNLNFNLVNNDNQFIDKNNLINFHNIFKKNQVTNTIQETINLDNELENFQNYTNINSENGPYNTNSSKSK